MSLYINKEGLSNIISEKIGISKKQSEEILDTLVDEIIKALKDGREVRLTGFGTFSARRREARMGVNPQKPSEKIQIPAVTVAKFKAGKVLKESLKQSS